MFIDMAADADMVLFNRCTPDMPLSGWKRSVRAVNRMCEIVFEDRAFSYLHRNPKKRMSSTQQVIALRPGTKEPLGRSCPCTRHLRNNRFSGAPPLSGELHFFANSNVGAGFSPPAPPGPSPPCG